MQFAFLIRRRFPPYKQAPITIALMSVWCVIAVTTLTVLRLIVRVIITTAQLSGHRGRFAASRCTRVGMVPAAAKAQVAQQYERCNLRHGKLHV